MQLPGLPADMVEINEVMTNLGDIIRDNDIGGSSEETAWEVIVVLLADHLDLAAETLFPLVHDQIRRNRRAAARRAEDTAFRPLRDRPYGEPAGEARFENPVVVSIRRVLDEEFWDPVSGHLVSWREAHHTVHRARIAYIEEHMIQPALLDIDRHRLAAELIEQAGAECLGDLDCF